MAGPFYNAATGIGLTSAGASATESPVAPVTISAADGVTAGLNLASQGVAMYGQYQRSQGSGGTRSGRPDPNVAVFAEEMNKVQQIRSEQGDLAGRLAERSVASNFAAAGVSFKDKAYKSVYESTTGRSFDVYGRDDDEYFRQKALESPEVQAAFMASKAILGPGTSTEEGVEWSLNEVREQKAAVLKLSQAQNDATMAWQVGGEEGTGSSKAFRTVRQGFVSRFSGGLLKKFEDGELVTPKDIAMAKVEWTTLKANALRRPPNLSGAAGNAQWEAFEAGNKSIDDLFTSLESATDNKTFLDSQVAIIANEVKNSSSFSELEKVYITAGLFSKDPNVYLGMLGEKQGELFKKLRELKITPTVSPSDALNNSGFTPIPSSGYNLPLGLRSTVSYEIKDDEKTKYTGMTGKQIANQITGTAAHAKVFVPGSMSKAENREAFGKTMTGMIAALQSSDQKDFFSPAYLRDHVLNPTILATLEAYKKSDPGQADLLRGGLQLGYQMEKTRQQQSLSSIEAGEKIARYTRFNEETNSYELNVNEFSSGFAGDVTAFNDAMRDHYNNNLSEAARDKFDKIVNTGGRVSLDRLQGNVARNVVIFSDLDQLTHAVKRRDAIAALDIGISDLSLNQETGETELDQGQTMDQAPPPAVVQPADQGSPRPTDEEDGRSLLQRGLEMIFSPAASSELTPELRAQLEAVRTRLPPTRPEGLPGDTPEVKSTLAPPMEGISRVIVKGESPLGYGDWNRGTSNGIPLNKAVAGKTVADNNIVELTHEEHLARSGPGIKADDPQRLFAIGRYQIIPTTAEGAFKFLGYSKKQKYTPEVQDNMFKYLLMGKRKPLYDYIKDEKGSDKDKAVLEMAKEFASIGVPYDVQVTVNKRKVTRKKGDSYYGQPAPTTPEDTGKQLDALRELYKKDPDALEPMGPKQKQAKAARTTLPPRRPEDTFVEDMRAAIGISPRPKN